MLTPSELRSKVKIKLFTARPLSLQEKELKLTVAGKFDQINSHFKPYGG